MILQNKPNTDDLRIKEIKELTPPAHVFREFPVGSEAAQTTFSARQAVHRILHGADDRLIKPLLGALEYGLEHDALLEGIAAADA